MKPDPLKSFFFLALFFLVFVLGAATMLFKVFPYQLFNKARISYRALQDAQQLKVTEDRLWPADMVEPGNATEPVASALAGAPGEELILVAGGLGQLKSHCPDYGCVAWLTDRRGQVKHVWQYDPTIWDDLKTVRGTGADRMIHPVGLHLFDNGDLLVSYQAKLSYPIGVGIAKFDKASKLLWKRADFNHHWFSVADTGEIYVPAMRVVDAPVPLGDTRFTLQCKQSKIALDAITVLSADGKLLREISPLESLLNSGYVGIIRNYGCDSTHINDLQVVGDVPPAYPPGAKKGDIFMSFRSLNALALLDSKTERFTWMSVGAAIEQHSVRYDGDQVYAFDNRGGPQGGSRIVRVDMPTGQSETVFPRPGISVSAKFFSDTAGHIDLHRDKQRLLIASTHQGLVWEIDLKSGAAAWEYVNTHPLNEKYARFPVYTAKYVYNAAFTFNQQEAAR